MRAVVLEKYGTGEEAFEIKEVEEVFPERDEVKIKVAGFGLNFADVMARKGLYRAAPELPCVLGYEVAGEVVEIGSAVSDLKIGDKVLANTRFGGYASYACAKESTTVKVKSLDNLGGLMALATQYTTALMCLEECVKIRPGETVLVHAAAGGVGSALVDLLKNKGAYVIGSVGSSSKLEHIKKHGVDLAVSYQKDDFWEEIIRYRPDGLDVIFDAVGGKVYKEGFKRLRSGGRMVTYGAAYRTNTSPGLISNLKMLLKFGFTHPLFLLMKSKTIVGVNMLEIGDHRTEILTELLARAVKLFESGIINPIVAGEFPVEDIAKIHQKFENRKFIGKITMKW